MQPAAALERCKQVSKQPVVIEHPVKRRGTEDSVKRFAERKGNEISGNELYVPAKFRVQMVVRKLHHILGQIETYHPSLREILKKQPGEFPRAAAGIQNALISPQVQVAENALPPLELRRRETMVVPGVPRLEV